MERMTGQDLTIDAELPVSAGTIRVIRQRWREPFDRCGVTPQHHLELSLMPHSTQARACYPAHWGPHRFEPIGEMFLFPGGELMHAKSDCQHQDSIVLEFDASSVAQWIEFEPEWTDHRLRTCLDIVNHDLRSLMFRIGEETRTPSLASNAMIELLAAQAVIELSRHIFGLDEERTIGGLSPWRLRLIDKRLMGDITPPSVTELAALCNISVRHLNRAFRVSRGRSLGNYVLEHRINHAKKLIASGMAVKSVACAMNFAASSNFTAAFRRATGETPREYKRRVSRNIKHFPSHAH